MAWLGRTKPVGSRSSGAWFLAQASGRTVPWCCFQGNWAGWLMPFVTCGAVGAVVPAYTGVLVSLMFQGEGSRLYNGSTENWVPLCAGKQDLTPNECQVMVMEPGAIWDFRGRVLGVLSCESFFTFFPWLVASLFADLEKAGGPNGCLLRSSDLFFKGYLVTTGQSGCQQSTILPPSPRSTL
jgi:hypothetical protein